MSQCKWCIIHDDRLEHRSQCVDQIIGIWLSIYFAFAVKVEVFVQKTTTICWQKCIKKYIKSFKQKMKTFRQCRVLVVQIKNVGTYKFKKLLFLLNELTGLKWCEWKLNELNESFLLSDSPIWLCSRVALSTAHSHSQSDYLVLSFLTHFFPFVLLQNNFVYLFIMLSNIYAPLLPLSIRISIIKMGLKLYRNKEMKNR